MLARDPATGRANPFSAGCFGWPLPVQQFRVYRTDASVVLSGHLYESVSVYQWTPQAQAAIGGTVFTVHDDVHGSPRHVAETRVWGALSLLRMRGGGGPRRLLFATALRLLRARARFAS